MTLIGTTLELVCMHLSLSLKKECLHAGTLIYL